MKQTREIIPALLTPFGSNGRIDDRALRALVERLITSGIDGFYVCGSTGEAFLMSPEERKHVLETVIDATRRRVKVICHVGAIGTELSCDLARHAQSAGADAVSSIPPFYYKFTSREIIEYYQDLARSVDLPLIPYNFPAFSGVALTGELMRELRKSPNVAGIKFTSNDLFELERMRSDDPALTIYSGLDEIMLASFAMGADGAIGSTFNVMPEKYLALRDAFLRSDLVEARRLQAEANGVINVLLKTGALLNAEKYLVELQGIDMGRCRSPFKPLSDEAKEAVRAVAARYLGLRT